MKTGMELHKKRKIALKVLRLQWEAVWQWQSHRF